MKATLEFVTEAFARFNTLCFKGQLREPNRFVISRARTFLGRLEFKNRYSFTRKQTSHYDYTIKISGVVDMPERLLEDVVIHEMIHYYIASNNIQDKSAHGPVFRSIMQQINTVYGRHISISHKSENNAVTETPKKYRILCVTTFVDDNQGITVCAKAKVFDIRKDIKCRYMVKRQDWYYSSNDFFARYPRSNTGKVYRISPVDLQTHLAGAIQLVCDDHSLRPVSNNSCL